MFNTKLEVDRHVEGCLRKINNESERGLRSFAFAKLYFKVGEYECARRYVSSYLTVKPLSAEAQSFLGKVLEKQGKTEAAIHAYRRSLALDPKQNGLVIKVCELLSSENIIMDTNTLRSYCEEAQRIDPHNPIVYNLKERLLAAESGDPNDVTKLLLTELETRPTDVHLRARLLRHLLDNNHVQEAYKHASDIETKNLPIFSNSLPWYEAAGEVLVRYQRENATAVELTSDFWMLLVSVLDKLASLTLNIHFSNIKTASECATAVFNLDQTLAIAVKHLPNVNEDPLVREFLNHYRAQICFHLSCLLYRREKMELFKDATNFSSALLFVAYNAQPPDINCMWLDHSSDVHKRHMKKWHREASFRCSQAGHILQANFKNKRNALVENVKQNCSGIWRVELFNKIFITRDEHQKRNGSYFVNCRELLNVNVQLPELGDLKRYDAYAQLMHPDSLHNLIWLCLNVPIASFKCTVFDGLQYSVRNLSNCSAESLNLLDVESFVYCATLTVESHQNDSFKLPLTPAAITHQLGTLQQSKWLKTAYAMYRNDYGVNLGDVRLNLIRGIEVVRCCGNHGLDVKLLVLLASAFAERANHLTKQSEIEFNEARADLYWKAALPLLEKCQNGQALSYGPNRLFDYKSKEMAPSEIASHIEDGRLFNGKQLLKKKEYEKALQVFDNLKNPYASYYQAQIYKAMAEEQLNQNKENVTSEMRSQHIILLSRSRDCYYLTLDRLRDPLVDRKHPLNKLMGTEIEKIERLLSRIDSDVYNSRNECDALSDENFSTNGGSIIGDHVNNFFSSTHYPAVESLTPHLDRTSYSNRFKTELHFKREARPSPERLDAQIRQMQATRDATMSHVIEQTRLAADSHRTLIEEFAWLKEAFGNVAGSLDDLREIKESIATLKGAVEELQSFRDVTDLLQEMKKEIFELKKEQTKTKNQLSDEDLYVLDDEYAADYGINSNVQAFNPAGLYPRLPPSYPQPPAALYPGMYPVYPYANLGLPQAGALPFGQEAQLADFRSLNLPQPLTQPNYGQPNKSPWDVGVVPPNMGQLIPPPQVPPQTQQTTNIFRDIVATTVAKPSIFPELTSTTTTPASANKAPINVVITSSDPLPKTTIATTQVLSVTIPPQHLKGNVPPKSQPHNYQIQLPTTSGTMFGVTPTVISQPPPVVTTEGLLSDVAPPVYSAVGAKNATLGLQIDKTLNQSFNVGDLSSRSNDEHDPCPDFQPIVPLPDEVPLNTGEENETVLFSERARLFRFTNKEWRERGVGNIKILRDKDTGKVRVVMRRDQVHKICANHFLTKDMTLSTMPNNGRAFMWAANDFSDQEMVLETLCVRFKTEDEASAFFAAFENAKAMLPTKDADDDGDVTGNANETSTSLGGFTFTSTPTFKPKEQSATPSAAPVQNVAKNSPFASFSFGSKPFVEKKEQVVEKTTEENAEILFESHAELSKFDVDKMEWKECAVGVIKLLKERVIQLVMRQDQQQKVCCNHQLCKSTKFKKMPKNPKAISWCAQDCIEGDLKPEMFTIHFESEEQSDTFYKAVTSAQLLLDDDNVVKSSEKVAIAEIKDDKVVKEKSKEEKKVKADNGEACEQKASKDKSKSKTGSWKCKNCYVYNEGKDHFCVACETPKNNTTPSKSADQQTFSFGISPPVTTSSSVKETSSWGDKFKPKLGTWECQQCLIRNDTEKLHCVACDSPKDSTVPKKADTLAAATTQFTFGIPSTGAEKFSFGIKPPAETTDSKTFSFESPQRKEDGSKEIYFKPVAAFAKKEEPEEVLLSERAQLYKFDEGDWKFGDVKILHNIANKTLRIVMHQDKTSKICLDCALTTSIEYQQKDETTWMFSNGKADRNKFVVKFKTSKAAKDFKFVIEDKLKCFKIVQDPNSEVEFVTEAQVSAAEEEEAVRLKLPPKFMAYRQLPDCECDTCKKDDTILGELFESPGKTTSASETLRDILAKPKLCLDKTGGGVRFSDTPSTLEFSPFDTTPKVFGTLSTQNEPMFKADPNLSFANLSSMKVGSAFEKKVEGGDKPFAFLGSGAPVFGKSPTKKGDGGEESEPEPSEEYDPHYEPIVPLPEAIVVSTGEEEEVALFDERAKLYRYDNNTKEWKERGVGQIKILHHPVQGTYRFILRREQVHKVVLNMLITPALDLQPMLSSDKAWLWYGVNHIDGESQPEQLAVRFKNCDLASDFHSKVTDVIGKIKSGAGDETKEESVDNESKDQSTPVKKTESVFAFGVSPVQSNSGGVSFSASQFSFGPPVTTVASSTSFVFGQNVICTDSTKKEHAWGDNFKPAPGSWECQQCLVRNDAEKTQCVSCAYSKDGLQSKESAKSDAAQFNFGNAGSVSFGFSFGQKSADTPKPGEENRDQFVFGSPQQHAFEFTPRSPRRHSSGGQGDGESDSFVEDEGDHIYFKPVVPLPNKIDVKTGEEEEEVLYCHRAKLFRFVNGEWKERGIGDIKILYNRTKGKLRVIMRREQVWKICLNHVLTADIEYQAKDEKTWLFSAPDFSEGEINHWQFCVRFKTSDVAREFKVAVDDALKKLSGPLSTVGTDKSAPIEDTSEVEFVSETQVSAEEEKEAIRLKLPPKFMAYRQLPDCECETCKRDDVILDQLLKATSPVTQTNATSPVTQTNAFKTFSFSLNTEASYFPQTPSKSLFSNVTFGTPSLGGSLFANAPKVSQNIFSNVTDAPVLKADPNLSFASLSNLKTDGLVFGKKPQDDQVFAFMGSGEPVFGSKPQPKKKEGDDSDAEAGDEYDPHFEPIVPLPEMVVVSTGEEEELAVFDERAKLFRYDNTTKEWKERGVGQMKILHHPVKSTYRFILRREQVHKVVLNMLITGGLDMQPLVMSDKAWMWYGVNHTDEGQQTEKLAVRFKSCELAGAFHSAVQNVLSSIQENEKALPSILQNFGLDANDEHGEDKDEEDEDDDEDDEEDDEDDDDDEEERTIMFMKTCRISEEVRPGEWKDVCSGDLSLCFEPDYDAFRIFLCDASGNEIINTIIEADTEMTFDDNYCIWKTADWQGNNAQLRTVKATFSTSQDAENFHCRYLESLQYAHETNNDEE